MPAGELSRRLAVAAVGIPAALVAVYLGGWVLGVVLAAIAAGAAVEFYRLAASGGVRPFVAAGAVASAAMVLAAAATRDYASAAGTMVGVALVLWLGSSAAAIWRRGTEGRPLPVAAVTVAGSLYTGGTLAFGVLLRHMLDGHTVMNGANAWVGAAVVAYPLAMTWLNDSFAFFAGHAWGRRKLIPSVSPGKTVVGAVAGLGGTVVAGAVYGAVVFHGGLGVPLRLAFEGPAGALVLGAVGGVAVSVAAQVGDLVESVFKREAGVKDSGRVFPGHGGLLDRFDALFFTFPVTFALFAVALSAGGRGM